MKQQAIFSLIFLVVALGSSANNTANASWLSDRLGIDARLPAVDKTIDLCGVEITVNAAIYGICQLAINAIPPACTVGAATTAGTACGLSIGGAIGACGVSGTTLVQGAQQCINKAK